MNHNNFAGLYTQIKILSMIEIDDSISDTQHKTSFSFVTTQKAVNKLEKKQLIKTEKKINKKGKARECIWYSKQHRIFCRKIMAILDKMDLYLNSDIEIESDLLYEIDKIKIKRSSIDKQSTLEIYREVE